MFAQNKKYRQKIFFFVPENINFRLKNKKFGQQN